MGMSRSFLVVAVIAIAALLNGVPRALGQDSCVKTAALKNGTERTYQTCTTLAKLGATLAWTYTATDPSSGGTLDFAYTAPISSGGWIGWGFNPTSAGMMAGSSVLLAYQSSSNSDTVNQYKLDSSTVGGTSPTPVASNGDPDLVVLDKSANVGTSSATIFALLQLKPGQTSLNHIWNQGPSVSSDRPAAHGAGDSYLSYGTIDVQSGAVQGAGNEKSHKENRHAIINGIAWGILFPLGVMIARYMRPSGLFDPAWFYSHVVCQICAYILGVTGWALGLKLITDGVHQYKHRNIGIALFVISTVQLFALVLRPKPDHKFRKYWNMYHYAVGYTIIILSIVNIFEGFTLLTVAQKGWKHAYIGIIIAMAVIAAILEALTWAAWYRKKSSRAPQRMDNLTADHEAGNGNGFHHDGMGHKFEEQRL